MSDDASGFELRDHTADIALFVWGDTPGSLFCAAAEGLYATIGELKAGQECHNVALSIEAGGVEYLLHDFLSELHYRFETAGVMLRKLAFDRLGDGRLEATAEAVVVDRAASVFDREVKAVTLHEVAVLRRAGRYEVTLILDI